MTDKTKKILKLAGYALGFIISVSIVTVLVANSWDSFVKIWAEVRTKYLVTAFFLAVFIYVFMGLSLWEVLKVMGRKISPVKAVAIALVSTSVNYLVSSLGVSGFALRAHMLSEEDVPFGLSVTASVVITVLLYLVLGVIILQGSILLLFKSETNTMEVVQGLLLITGMATVCVVIIQFLFKSELRVVWLRKGFRFVNRVIYTLFSVLIRKSQFDNFKNQLEVGISAIQSRIGKLTPAVAYICADWLFTMLVLYFAFRAVGLMISPIVLVAGFAVGMATTLIPILPGGLGAMELAMTAVYAKMGIEWDKALMACLIYRVLYYIMPGIISIFVYWIVKANNKIRRKKREAANA